MLTFLVQLLGGILGILIAWAISYLFERHQDKKTTKLRLQHKLELENYKKSLVKSR